MFKAFREKRRILKVERQMQRLERLSASMLGRMESQTTAVIYDLPDRYSTRRFSRDIARIAEVRRSITSILGELELSGRHKTCRQAKAAGALLLERDSKFSRNLRAEQSMQSRIIAERCNHTWRNLGRSLSATLVR